MTDFYSMEHATYQDTGLYQQLTQRFIAETKGDILHERISLALEKATEPLRSVVNKFRQQLIEARVTMPLGRGQTAITGKFKTEPMFDPHPVFVWIASTEYAEAVKLTIDIFGDGTAVQKITKAIGSEFDNKQLPLIRWYYQDRHNGTDTKDFYMTDADVGLRPEYYPDLGDPDKLLNDYMESSESIMLISGPPGTGKTTLLRHLIIKYKLCAHIIYDEKLMERDDVFQTFLFGDGDCRPAREDDIEVTPQRDVMIIEDADTILASRERDGNKIMSRFLNVSDGLIKLPNKKLIFTTNINDFANVDHALMRPGRCFATVQTRMMHLAEAQQAAKVAGLPIPLEKREYTLAEIFNQGKKQQVRTIGFGTRH